jgi:hypothetical protein
MTSSPPSLALIGCGLAAIAASFIWPALYPAAGWDTAKAQQLQAAQSQLHRLAGHGDELSPSESKTASAASAEHEQAFETHQRLRAELEQAQSRNLLVARALLWGGAALVVGGWLRERWPARVPPEAPGDVA